MITRLQKSARSSRALVTCDFCGAQEEMAADYHDNKTPHEGQLYKRLIARGWHCTKKNLKCPDCIVRDKTPNEEPPVKTTNITPLKPAAEMPPAAAPANDLRQPSREQRRAILDLLGVCYDTEAERYKGNETDKTLADTIGDGVLPGWVAAIREEFFGPAGSNEGMDEVIADIKEFKAKLGRVLSALEITRQNRARLYSEMDKAMDGMQAELTKGMKMGDELIARVEAIKKAVGPKVGGK